MSGGKPHGSNPRARRLARNGEAKLARADKQAERRARHHEPIKVVSCRCGRNMPGICFDIDGAWWNGHGPADEEETTP